MYAATSAGSTNLGLDSHGSSAHPKGGGVSEGWGRGGECRTCHLPTRRYELLHESLWWPGGGGGGQVVGRQASGKAVAVEGWGGGEVGDRRCWAPGGWAALWGGGRGGVCTDAVGAEGGLGAGTLKRLAHITKVRQAGHL